MVTNHSKVTKQIGIFHAFQPMDIKTKYEVISMKMDHILLPESWDFSNGAFWTAFDSEIAPGPVDD